MNHFFGRNLKMLRREKKLSQTELGERLNKGQKTIGNWETGYSEPCMDDLLRLSEFFEINIDSFLKQELIKNHLKTNQSSSENHNLHAETFPSVITQAKHVVQEAVYNHPASGNKEIAWRDKYITLLENHIAELVTHSASEETLRHLMNQVLSLQKMVTGLTDSVYTGKEPVTVS